MIQIAKNGREPKRGAEPTRFYTDIFPPLTPEAYDSLKRSIAEVGVQEPVIEDEEGGLIDGRHRQRATEELGVNCPRDIRHFESEAEKYELALTLNCQRRHLNRKQKRNLIEAYLLADPQISDNTLADILGGISKNTVADVRARLEATCQIDKLKTTRGRDGKERPRRYTRIIANTPKEVEVARKAIKGLPSSSNGHILDATTARRRARRHPRNKPPTPAPPQSNTDDCSLIQCRFQNLETATNLRPGSASLVCTDFPYGKDFLPELPALAELAARVLKDDGLLVTHSGVLYLDQVMEAFGQHLRYGWMLPSIWHGPARWLRCRAVNNRWKPVLVYCKNRFPDLPQWRDVLEFNGQEKQWHEWQQPLAEVEYLVKTFSQPGDLVIDPCGGSFTTAVACRNLGRRFIGCDVDEECVQMGWERLAEQQ